MIPDQQHLDYKVHGKVNKWWNTESQSGSSRHLNTPSLPEDQTKLQTGSGSQRWWESCLNRQLSLRKRQKCQIVDETQRAVEVLLLSILLSLTKKRNEWIFASDRRHYNGVSVCSGFHSSDAGENLSVLQFWVKFKEKIKVPKAESFEVLLLRQSECNSYNFQWNWKASERQWSLWNYGYSASLNHWMCWTSDSKPSAVLDYIRYFTSNSLLKRFDSPYYESIRVDQERNVDLGNRMSSHLLEVLLKHCSLICYTFPNHTCLCTIIHSNFNHFFVKYF